MSALAISVGPFAVPTSALVLLICGVVAVAVGHLVGRRQQAGIGGTVVDMLLAAALAARLAFVVQWFDNYRSAPWSLLDIRDGGYTPWAGLLAAAAVALWRGWRRAALRKPLLLGLLAGAMGWFTAPGLLRLGGGPPLAELAAIALITPQGQAVSLLDLAAGKPMVINLWATWCPPCRREMPVLAAAQQQLAGVSFVFVNQGEDGDTQQRYLDAAQLVLHNALRDPERALGQKFGSTALPTTLFYDASGGLVDAHLGALSAASLASKLQQLGVPGASHYGVTTK